MDKKGISIGEKFYPNSTKNGLIFGILLISFGFLMLIISRGKGLFGGTVCIIIGIILVYNSKSLSQSYMEFTKCWSKVEISGSIAK